MGDSIFASNNCDYFIDIIDDTKKRVENEHTLKQLEMMKEDVMRNPRKITKIIYKEINIVIKRDILVGYLTAHIVPLSEEYDKYNFDTPEYKFEYDSYAHFSMKYAYLSAWDHNHILEDYRYDNYQIYIDSTFIINKLKNKIDLIHD